MVYFFHHYELPVILQQAQLQQILRNHHHTVGQATIPRPAPATGPIGAAAQITTRLTQLLSSVRPNANVNVQTNDSNAQTTSTMSQTAGGRQATTQTSLTAAPAARGVNMASQVSHVTTSNVGTIAQPVTVTQMSQTSRSLVAEVQNASISVQTSNAEQPNEQNTAAIQAGNDSLTVSSRGDLVTRE